MAMRISVGGLAAVVAVFALCALVPPAVAATPDTRVRAISRPPAKLAPGSRIRLFVRVRVPRPATLRLRLSTDRRLDATDLPMALPRRLRPGASSVLVEARVASSTVGGRFRVIVCLRSVGARGSGHCRASQVFVVDATLPLPQTPPPGPTAPPPSVDPRPVDPEPAPEPRPTRDPVPIGTAIWWGCVDRDYAGPAPLACPQVHDPRYEEMARRFDAYVPENELKEVWIHPARDVWDFSVADRLVAWSQAQDKKVRGHVLVYGDATPWWKVRTTGETAIAWTRDALLAEMRTHIATVMDHYAVAYPGVIDEWDVVNEAFEDSGGRDDNVYNRVIGADYVEQAFLAAREADPQARLFYNEYNADRPGTARAEAVYAMVADFRARGVPIDGVGLQMHIGTGGNSPTPAELATQFERYGALGVAVQFTETDVGTSPTPAGLDPLTEQAEVYREIGASCYASANCRRVMVWGVADHLSWRGLIERPLLLNGVYAEKPAWSALRAALGARDPPGDGPG